MSQVQNLTNLYTGRGRFVSGDLDKKQDKDYENKPIPPEEQEYYFAVAVPKTSAEVGQVLAQLHGLATQSYQQAPHLLAQVNMGLSATSFSWKVEDGDVPKVDTTTGQPKKIPEYIQGCYVFKFKTKYEFGACDAQFNNIDRTAIKRGDYVDVMFTATPNGRFDGNAGIILYPNAIAFLDAGEAISGTVDAANAFKGRTMEGSGAAHPSAGTTYQPQQQMGGGMPQQQMGGGMPQQQQMGGGGGMPQAGGGMPQQQMDGGGMPQAGGGMPQQQMGNPMGGGMPQANGGQQMDGGGGMPQAGGGMPQQQQAMGTTSHGDPAAMGVQPHNQILSGPQTGGGMPGA